MTTNMDVINIADRGDAILEVDQFGHTRKLKVDTHMLRAASKTFDAMFGPNFSEGQGLDYRTPKQITLEDDHGEAMEAICKIIHYEDPEIPEEERPFFLHKMALIVDKYGLHKAVGPELTLYMLDSINGKNVPSMFWLMEAARLLEDARAYKAITKFLIFGVPYKYIADYISPTGEEPRQMIMSHCSSFRMELLKILLEASMTADLYGFQTCDYLKELTSGFNSWLKSKNLLPKDMDTKTITQYLNSFATFDTEMSAGLKSCTTCIYKKHHSSMVSTIKELLCVKMAKLGEFEGLELPV